VNDYELANLNTKVKRSGLSRESYIRSLLNGYIPREQPDADFFTLIHELHTIGNQMKQIAVKANTFGVIDAPSYANSVQELCDITQRIYEAVMLPERIVKMDNGNDKTMED